VSFLPREPTDDGDARRIVSRLTARRRGECLDKRAADAGLEQYRPAATKPGGQARIHDILGRA
jgi:hypothetical protein